MMVFALMRPSILQNVPPEQAPGLCVRMDLSNHRLEGVPELTGIPVGEVIEVG
jgi:hypothetical protein